MLLARKAPALMPGHGADVAALAVQLIPDDAREHFGVLMLDAIGVPLEPGQRGIFAVAGIHAAGELVPGTITGLACAQRRDGAWAQRIDIRRDDGQVVRIG